MEEFQMIENTDVKKNTPARKLKFAEAFENIMALPFRAIGLVWKAYWIVIKVISVFLMAGIIAITIRSAFPMNLPEARGMTYYEFVKYRWISFRETAKDPEDPHMEYVAAIYALYFEEYLIAAFPVSFCELFPGSKFDLWVRENINGSAYEHFKPDHAVTWRNLPESLWETWERSSWYRLVETQPNSVMMYPPE
jgi:hypothetical protein